MESFLKSFISSLEELPGKKGRRFQVTADIPPGTEGEIRRWYPGDGDWVEGGRPLCEIEFFGLLSGTTRISSPAAGILRIKVRAGKRVDEGEVIAYVEERMVV